MRGAHLQTTAGAFAREVFRVRGSLYQKVTRRSSASAWLPRDKQTAATSAPAFKFGIGRSTLGVGRLPGAWLGNPQLVVEGKKLSVSNLDKILYPKAGFAKGQVIDYYIRVAPVLLPHLKDRPLTMKRYPDGVEGEFFYEKNCPTHRPKWVKTAKVWSESNNRTMNYCLAQDLPTLVWAANLADLELHTSLSRKQNLDRPTVMVFDLDPGAPADIVQCCRVGLWLRDLLGEMKLKIFCQDERLKRSAGLRAAQYGGDVRSNEGTFSRDRGASRARAWRPCHLEHVEGAAERQSFRRLEPERRAQDDDLRLFPSCQGRTDSLDSGHLGRSRGLPEKEKGGRC